MRTFTAVPGPTESCPSLPRSLCPSPSLPLSVSPPPLCLIPSLSLSAPSPSLGLFISIPPTPTLYVSPSLPISSSLPFSPLSNVCPTSARGRAREVERDTVRSSLPHHSRQEEGSGIRTSGSRGSGVERRARELQVMALGESSMRAQGSMTRLAWRSATGRFGVGLAVSLYCCVLCASVLLRWLMWYLLLLFVLCDLCLVGLAVSCIVCATLE